MTDQLDLDRVTVKAKEPAKRWKVRVVLRCTADITGWDLRLRPGQPWVWPHVYPSSEIAEQAIADWIEKNRLAHPDIDRVIQSARPFPVEAA